MGNGEMRGRVGVGGGGGEGGGWVGGGVLLLSSAFRHTRQGIIVYN